MMRPPGHRPEQERTAFLSLCYALAGLCGIFVATYFFYMQGVMATNRSIKDEGDGIAALFVMLFAVTIWLGWRLTTTLRTQAEQASKMNELTRKLETIEGQQKKMSMMREASSRVGAKP